MLNLARFIFLYCCLQTYTARPISKDCGRRLIATSGAITTPNYPNTYPYDKTCKWIIEAPVGHIVELKFLDFDVEEFDGECETDEVQVRDGEDESAPLLMGKALCGNTVPEVTTSSGRYLLIYFFSDFLSMGGRGFKAIYVTKPDSDLHGRLFTSPISTTKDITTVVPDENITTSKSSTIFDGYLSLFYRNRQRMEAVDVADAFSLLRSSDNITSRINQTTTSPSIIESTSATKNKNNVDVIDAFSLFRDADNITSRIIQTTISPSIIESTKNKNKDCGGRLIATSGVITTPNYPNTYPYEKICEWVIEAPVGHVVELSFVDFDVEEFDGECETDEVHVRDGEDESAPLLMGKILCGQTIPEVTTSSGRYLLIYFSSDYVSMGGRGFEAIYTTKLDENIATIKSSTIFDGYLSPLHRNTQRREVVDVIDSSSSLSNFQLDTIKWRINETATSPSNIKSTSDKKKNNNKDCGGRLNATSGEITTPNYPSLYPYAEHCKWVIEAPVGHVVELEFIDFDIEEDDGECTTDEVHVRDGEDESAPLLMGKILCGQTVPEVTTSSGRYLLIYFSSFFLSMGGRGFKAIYVTKPDSHLHGKFTSLISTTKDITTVVPDENIATIKSSTIFDGYLSPLHRNTQRREVVDVIDSSSLFLGSDNITWRKIDIPPSDSTSALVTKLHSETSIKNENCGRRFNSSFGVITTPNYPNTYPYSKECKCIIEAPIGHVVQLQFLDFDVQGFTGECQTDKVHVRDGKDESGTLLTGKILCGQTIPQVATSSGRHMFIHFSSSFLSLGGRGFKAIYATKPAEARTVADMRRKILAFLGIGKIVQ